MDSSPGTGKGNNVFSFFHNIIDLKVNNRPRLPAKESGHSSPVLRGYLQELRGWWIKASDIHETYHPAAGSSAIHTGNGSEPWKIPADESVLRLTTIIINDRGTKERGPTIVAFSQG